MRESVARAEPRRKLFRYYPDTGPLRRELYARHLEFFAAGGHHEPIPVYCPQDCDGSPHRDRLALAANRVGKALKHGTAVATPKGWRAIESLRAGDMVIAGNGDLTKVVGVYPQGVKPLYKLIFDVGVAIECCGEHLWLYQHPKSRYPYRHSHGAFERNPRFGEWSVGNTERILREVGSEPGPRQRPVIPACDPWRLPKREVPLDPYLVGLLVGDGGLTDYVRFTSVDQELVNALASLLPAGVVLKQLDEQSWVIAAPGGRGHSKGKPKGSTNPVRSALATLGLMGGKSDVKRIPGIYLYNAVDVRRAILQGLMDTDGSIGSSGAMEFSSASPGLADDVRFLVHSLGGKATIEQRQTHFTHKGQRRAGLPSYRVRIRLNECPFRLARKAALWKYRRNTSDRVLHRIESVAPALATCIEVEHHTHTFVIDHGIVTHNTEGIGGYETTLHLTGRYPEWWIGHRFAHPIDAWAAGKKNESTRDIVQQKLLGPVAWRGQVKTVAGTGLIPGEDIGAINWKRGIAELVDTVKVRHQSGGWSTLGIKSYEQGRGSFEGTEKHIIWLDEEPPLDIYVECGIRVMTTGGHLLLTFTPMEGMSEVVLEFLPGGALPGQGTV